MIVKIQISQNDGGQMTLVYNQDRSLTCQFKTTPEIRRVLAGEPKAYFHFRIIGDDLQVGERAPDQDW